MTNNINDEACDVFLVDEAKVNRVSRQFSKSADLLIELSETFKLLADPTRLKIILALREEELCVCDLAALLKVTRSAISHQLRQLRNLRLVKYRRDGKIAYYSLKDTHIYALVDTAMEHLQEDLIAS